MGMPIWSDSEDNTWNSRHNDEGVTGVDYEYVTATSDEKVETFTAECASNENEANWLVEPGFLDYGRKTMDLILASPDNGPRKVIFKAPSEDPSLNVEKVVTITKRNGADNDVAFDQAVADIVREHNANRSNEFTIFYWNEVYGQH